MCVCVCVCVCVSVCLCLHCGLLAFEEALAVCRQNVGQGVKNKTEGAV